MGLRVTVLVLLVLAAVWLLWAGDGGRVVPVVVEHGRADAVIAGEADGSRGEVREEVPGELEGTEASEDAAGFVTLRVFAVRADRSPVLGATVEVEDHARVVDARGMAEFEVEPRSWFVSVTPPDGERLTPSSGRVAVLEDREVYVELFADDRTVFFARLLDLATGAPAAGVEAEHNGSVIGEKVLSGADGMLRVEGDPERGWVAVHDVRYAPVRIPVREGHGTAKSAFEVRLAAAASLVVRVLDDGDRPIAGAEVSLTAMSAQLSTPQGIYRGGFRQSWAGASGDDGVARLPRLPVRVALELAVTHQGRRVQTNSAALTLEPGPNEHTIRIAQSRAVAGVVVDQDGQPVVGVAVEALPATAAEVANPRIMPWWNVDRSEPGARTDDAGEFELVLPLGIWIVGVTPWPATAAGLAELEVAPVCARVELTAAGLPRPLRLVAPRALTIEGVAVTDRLDPVGGVQVAADHVGSELTVFARTGDDGRFVLPRLLPGTYELSVDESFDGPLATPQSVRCEAGDRGVRLELSVVAGVLQGVVVHAATGATARAWVMAYCGERAIGGRAGLDGRFRFEGMRSGEWDVLATDRAGRAAHTYVLVRAGVEHEVRLALDAGAELVLRHPPTTEAVTFQILLDGRVIGEDPIGGPRVGIVSRRVVPPGRYVVRFLRDGQVFDTQAVEVSAGASVEVTPAE